MSSFVNMMANDVWSQADIDNRVQAMIRSRYSENDELKAARLARSGDDPVFVAAVDGWIAECVQAGRQAKTDMALLLQVFEAEAANRRLAMPTIEPELNEEGAVLNQDSIDADLVERAAAQALVSGFSLEVQELCMVRNPPVPDEPAPEVPVFDE